MATLQNIGILKYRDKDGNWHPLPVVLQSSGGGSGGVSTISGKGQPGTSTVGRLNQLYRDESTDKLYICTSDTGGSYTWAAVVSDTENAVTYTAQTLTNAQKQQARENIGAGTSNFSGSYNDLTNKPNIPAASVIDTTLTQSGQAADAKAVGDALADKADTAAVNSALANKANTTDVNSALANKVDTTTLNTELAKKADTSAIPNVPAWALAASKPTYTASEVGALPNTTVIPDVSGKLDKAQGTANAGKFMGVGNDGNITPVDKPTYTLPIAAANVLGGVKPVEKTTAMTQDVGVDSAGKLYTAPSSGGSGGTDKSLGITSATVGQIAKITAVDTSGKPTAWETVDMPSVSNDYELVFQETVAEDAASYSRDTDKDGNPFSLTDVMIIIFTKPFAETTYSAGRALGFLPTTKWGHDTLGSLRDTIKSGESDVGRYEVIYAKVINNYQIGDKYYESQNTTSVFGAMMQSTRVGATGIMFHSDAEKLMEISNPQGNITCVKIVGYTNPLVSAGTIVALYKKKGT